MALIVQKYGGTSVGSIDRIKNVAQRVLKFQAEGNQIVVAVSAMSGETNRLLGLAKEISQKPSARENDVLVSTGEQVSIALLAMAIQELGGQAVSFLGHQVRIGTDSAHGKARIKSIDADNIKRCLSEGKVVIVAGFQGVNSNFEITTLGRGGSDTTGVALAAALKADRCQIFTDVDGVYTTDPNICENASKIETISYEEMLEMASTGAKVLQIRSVEMAAKFNVPIEVRCSFNNKPGTLVTGEESNMEKQVVTAVSYNKDEAKISIRGLKDQPNVVSQVFEKIADANINVDMIVQNVSSAELTDLTFTVPRSEVEQAVAVVQSLESDLKFSKIENRSDIAKVSVIGIGMRSHAGVAATMFQVLGKEGINIQLISTSEIKISVIVEQKYTELAVRVLHDAFELGQNSEEK